MGLEVSDDENLLVGFETSDDAAVYRLTAEIALISTVDYITPPVDDPYWFGRAVVHELGQGQGFFRHHFLQPD